MAEGPKLRVLSLGGGTQSTVLALRAAEFGGVDCAIFADTGWEPRQVYENLEWLKRELPYPVYCVVNRWVWRPPIAAHIPRSLAQVLWPAFYGNRTEPYDLLRACERGTEATGYPGMAPPVFLKGGKKEGMAWRQCTDDFKVHPIMRKIRELLGVSRRGRIPPGTVEQWLGLSADEAQRVKPSRTKYVRFRHPLVDAGITRSASIAWFRERYPGRILPRSACVGCPYQSAREWVAVRRDDPEMWRRTVALDRSLRNGRNIGLTLPAFLHRRCLPLDEAVDADEQEIERRRRSGLFPDFGDGWGNECAGVCGV